MTNARKMPRRTYCRMRAGEHRQWAASCRTDRQRSGATAGGELSGGIFHPVDVMDRRGTDALPFAELGAARTAANRIDGRTRRAIAEPSRGPVSVRLGRACVVKFLPSAALVVAASVTQGAVWMRAIPSELTNQSLFGDSSGAPVLIGFFGELPSRRVSRKTPRDTDFFQDLVGLARLGSVGLRCNWVVEYRSNQRIVTGGIAAPHKRDELVDIPLGDVEPLSGPP